MALANRIVSLTLERPIYGGDCIGWIEGKAVLVPFGMPGEKVVARVIEEKKDYCLAVIEETSGGGSRIAPACPNFGQCGGCSYQHMDYATEIEVKKMILLDSLRRIGRFSDDSLPAIEVHTGGRYRYRGHATFQVKNGDVGFYRKGSEDLVRLPPQGCAIAAEPINAHIALIERSKAVSKGTLRVALDDAGIVRDSAQKEAVVSNLVGGIEFTRAIGCFFQANRFLRERLMGIVVDWAGLSKRDFIDIGCGVGFFSLALAARGGHGLGIDMDRESIQWARYNAAHNGISGVEFSAMPSSRLHPGRCRPPVVVADPPRAGLDRKTRGAIMAMRPEIVVYVSCSPPTFSRDARDFYSGGYLIDRIALVDMFPCTFHIETAARFVRPSSPTALS